MKLKYLHIFINTILFLLSLVAIVYTLGIIIKKGFDVDALVGWPFVLLLLYSGYLAINLIKKKEFENKMKHTLNFTSFSLIIFTALILLTMFLASTTDGETSIGYRFLGYFVFVAGALITFILGLIGFFLDKKRAKKD